MAAELAGGDGREETPSLQREEQVLQGRGPRGLLKKRAFFDSLPVLGDIEPPCQPSSEFLFPEGEGNRFADGDRSF